MRSQTDRSVQLWRPATRACSSGRWSPATSFIPAGASLLGAAQTWLITGRYEWPGWLFWLLLAVMLGLSVRYTALRMSRDSTAPRP